MAQAQAWSVSLGLGVKANVQVTTPSRIADNGPTGQPPTETAITKTMNSHVQPSESAASKSLSSALDDSALARLRQLDPTGQRGLLQRVFATYRLSLQRLRSQIAGVCSDADNNELRMGVHTLKSSSASVGALELSKLCGAIEAAIRDDQRQALPALIRQTQDEIDRVDEAVRDVMPN